MEVQLPYMNLNELRSAAERRLALVDLLEREGAAGMCPCCGGAIRVHPVIRHMIDLPDGIAFYIPPRQIPVPVIEATLAAANVARLAAGKKELSGSYGRDFMGTDVSCYYVGVAYEDAEYAPHWKGADYLSPDGSIGRKVSSEPGPRRPPWCIKSVAPPVPQPRKRSWVARLMRSGAAPSAPGDRG